MAIRHPCTLMNHVIQYVMRTTKQEQLPRMKLATFQYFHAFSFNRQEHVHIHDVAVRLSKIIPALHKQYITV